MAIVNFTGRVIGQKEYGPQRAIVGLELTGVDRLVRALDQLGRRAPEALAGALFREANVIMTASKQQVPVDTGALRGSGHVALPVVEGTRVSVELGYGGPAGAGNHGGETNDEAVGYATYVHEDLTAVHPSGKAKFLEDPMLAAAPDLEQRLAKDLARDLAELRR